MRPPRARRDRLCVLAVLCALVACSDGSPAPLTTPTSGSIRILDRVVTIHGRTFARGSSASIEAFDDFFAPTVLSGPPGKEVLFILRNGGERLHNFSLPSAGFDRDLPPGDIREVKARFPASGELVPFFCKYHRDSAAMLGAITGSP